MSCFVTITQGGHTTWFPTSFWLHRQADLEVNNGRLIFWKCDHCLVSHSILMTYGAVEGETISIRIYLQLFATRAVIFSRKHEKLCTIGMFADSAKFSRFFLR